MKIIDQKPTIAVALAALALSALSTNANVSYVGSIQDNSNSQVSSWSDVNVAKTFDLDGDNYYGSDGYTWMNDSGNSAGTLVLNSLVESAPSYAGGIAYTGAGVVLNGEPGRSGSTAGAADRLLPDGTGTANVGYAGVNYGNTTGATVLQTMFAYTMNRDMVANETIRLGVVVDSLAGTVGIDLLQVRVGANIASATGLNRNASMDMYFFDLTGLATNDQIEIWGSKDVDDASNFNWLMINGATFDSTVIPEPSTASALLGGLGLFMALLRRRRSR